MDGHAAFFIFHFQVKSENNGRSTESTPVQLSLVQLMIFERGLTSDGVSKHMSRLKTV